MEGPDFAIVYSAGISGAFLQRGITTFREAADYVSRLPYGRNADKTDLATVFSDGCGTCSTKHALLKVLANENDFDGLKLMVGIFKMNHNNTPAVAGTLGKYGLDHIPEAHCYLRYNRGIFDHTFSNVQLDFVADLMEEQEIEPLQITDWKVAYHKTFINKWLAGDPQIVFSAVEIWEIREQCIRDISV